MQIEDQITTALPYSATPHYFSAILFHGWRFWAAGPEGPTRAGILDQLALYDSVDRAIIIKTYVPTVG